MDIFEKLRMTELEYGLPGRSDHEYECLLSKMLIRKEKVELIKNLICVLSSRGKFYDIGVESDPNNPTITNKKVVDTLLNLLKYVEYIMENPECYSDIEDSCEFLFKFTDEIKRVLIMFMGCYILNVGRCENLLSSSINPKYPFIEISFNEDKTEFYKNSEFFEKHKNKINDYIFLVNEEIKKLQDFIV